MPTRRATVAEVGEQWMADRTGGLSLVGEVVEAVVVAVVVEVVVGRVMEMVAGKGAHRGLAVTGVCGGDSTGVYGGPRRRGRGRGRILGTRHRKAHRWVLCDG